LQASDYSARNLEFFPTNIPDGRPNQAVEVRVLSRLRIIQCVILEADMGRLLTDVRTATTQSNNSDCCPFDNFLTAFAQE
jgi:hypothetical protein